ncbi:hypothetical protein SAMN05216274_102240 [Cryobacterium levicorallinum]|uniref:Uncharacterized protein n=1 Tax=Cryobacterium levicorallinum TaxID=995038 RepID=A0ABY1EAG3_9MICO|nr:hypothetical protein SAMN05216274_102240 [Cryobacterium levicorallinum]
MTVRGTATRGVASSRRRGLLAVAFVAAVAVVSGLGLLSVRAVAVIQTVTTVSEPGILELTSSLPHDAVLDLTPGKPVYWQIGAALTQDLTGSLVLEIRKSGDLATNGRGLILVIDRCSEPWTNLETTPRCTNEREHVLVATPLDDNSSVSGIYDLAGISEARGKYLLVALSLNVASEAAGNDLMGLSGEVGIGLTAAGDNSSTGPAIKPPGGSYSAGGGDNLALTGIDALALVLVAVGVLALGIVVSMIRRFAEMPAADDVVR